LERIIEDSKDEYYKALRSNHAGQGRVPAHRLGHVLRPRPPSADAKPRPQNPTGTPHGAASAPFGKDPGHRAWSRTGLVA